MQSLYQTITITLKLLILNAKLEKILSFYFKYLLQNLFPIQISKTAKLRLVILFQQKSNSLNTLYGLIHKQIFEPIKVFLSSDY